jgi:hypothetical protein
VSAKRWLMHSETHNIKGAPFYIAWRYRRFESSSECAEIYAESPRGEAGHICCSGAIRWDDWFLLDSCNAISACAAISG